LRQAYEANTFHQLTYFIAIRYLLST